MLQQRRSFLSRVGMGLAAFGGAGGLTVPAQAQGTAGARWQPVRHPQDDWLDQIPGQHRLVVDTTTPEGFGQAMLFVNNYFGLNHESYGLQDADLAVVIVARHHSTPYALTDAMWAKYGAGMMNLTGFNDPNTKQPPLVNVYNSTAYGATLLNRGILLDGLLKRGVHLAVCEVGIRTAASMSAAATGGNMDAINRDMVANRLANSHMVPAGIVALNRAQERGYAFSYAAGV